ncbi:hypothetical protein OZX57_02220 [Bifidobacterium sp. ESL0682]|uniref:hypothetical protein n=1 Tax=Bifidobacterium sp. ESL0682 TaxID=2983212 RepID=UPI0023FA1B9E|nr:hypothetical protein [Bifidobacterium sp. ESL0682]WEV42311.1 hypothetical protein OZX57_02220 [Bifidobacterium sp. ESL0682]
MQVNGTDLTAKNKNQNKEKEMKMVTETNIKKSVALTGVMAEGISKANRPYKYVQLKTEETGEDVARLYLSPLSMKALGLDGGATVRFTGVKENAVSREGKPYTYLSVRYGNQEIKRLFLETLDYVGLGLASIEEDAR